MAIAIAMSSGVGVGPSFLEFRLALPSRGWGFAFALLSLVVPFLHSLSGGWPFLEWGLALGVAFSECGHWPFCLRVGGSPFLLAVRVGPPLSGPSVFLVVVVVSSFLQWEFALSFWSGSWPFLLGVRVVPAFLVGVRVLGLPSRGWGFAFARLSLVVVGLWPCVLGLWALAFLSQGGGFALPSWGEGWSSLLGPVRLSHGGGCLFLLAVGVRPLFFGVGLALPSRGWGFAIALLSLVVPFLLSLSGGWPFLEWGLALGPAFSECGHWPFCLREGSWPGEGWPTLLGEPCSSDRAGQPDITPSVIKAHNLSENIRVKHAHDGNRATC